MMVVVVVALGWGGYQQQQIASLRRQQGPLKPLVTEARDLAEQIQSWRGLEVDTHELERLRSRHLELLRLRGEIGELRRSVQLDPESAEREREALLEQATAMSREAQRLEGILTAEDRSREAMQLVSQASAFTRALVEPYQGRIPSTWAEVRQQLEAWEERVAGVDSGLSAELRQILLQQLPEIEVFFDLIPMTSQPDPDEQWEVANHTLILRERVPREMPDQGWARAYAFLSGRVEEVTLKDGDFAGWEYQATRPTTGN
jgi:hypothetical protein